MASANLTRITRRSTATRGRPFMPAMAIGLSVIGTIGLTATVSPAQTTENEAQWRFLPEPVEQSSSIVFASSRNDLRPPEFVAPMFSTMEKQAAVILPQVGPFQPGDWNNLQTDEDRENPFRSDQAIAPEAIIPVVHYQVLQVALQEGVGQRPAGNAATEAIPRPPSEEELLGAPITSLTADIRVKENPNVKDDFPPSAMPAKLRRNEMSYVMNRPGAAGICYAWDAPATCNNPLYFEETNLERHGYSPRYLRAFQPVLSGAEFFATIPTLPYQLVAMPLNECVYTLGEYRPGSCVPYQINYPPWSTAGGIVEAGTAVGLIFLIP